MLHIQQLSPSSCSILSIREGLQMMKEKTKTVFSIADSNKPVPGCTVSKTVSTDDGYGISYFSLAANTSISAESYGYPKLWLVLAGEMEVFTDSGTTAVLKAGNIYCTPVKVPVGNRTDTGCVYTEITLKEDSNMNQMLKSKEVFTLKNLLPYQEGKIINMDLINDEKLKFVVMSFDAGTGLAEHAAPGEALVFALDGEAVIGYEGKEYPIKAGENFKFDKMGRHYIKAETQFKMALLLTLE